MTDTTTIVFRSTDSNLLSQILKAASSDEFREIYTYEMYFPASNSRLDLTPFMKTLAELCENSYWENFFWVMKDSKLVHFTPLTFRFENGRMLEVHSRSRISLLKHKEGKNVYIGDRDARENLCSKDPDTSGRVHSFLRGY